MKLIEDPRVRLLEHNSPKNAAPARNFGLRFASGKYITYLDDDDSYLPNKLLRQWELAEKTQSPLVLCGLIYHLGWRTRRKQIDKYIFSGSELLLNVYFATPTFFHLNNDHIRFNEELHANEDACKRRDETGTGVGVKPVRLE